MTDMRVLETELPEDIRKAKWAGAFALAQELIAARLADAGCPKALRERLLLERDRLATLPGEYPFSREEAVKLMRRRIPGFPEEELDALDRAGATDWLFVDGQRRYHEDFDATLVKMLPALAARAGRPQREDPLLAAWMDELAARGTAGRRLRMRAELRVEDPEHRPGAKYRVWLPIPAQAPQTEEIRLLRFSHAPDAVAPPEASQRTVFWQGELPADGTFFVEYEFVSRLRWFDPDRPPRPEVLYPAAPAPCEDDLAELPPHIRFAPFLRALAEEIRGDEDRPLAVARRYYDYITGNVRYSYLRAYLQIDHLAEETALQRKGDCGAQALLFISLCRLSGVPARWQSGLYAHPDDPGSHDWAQFYTPEYGWLFADCSFGGRGTRREEERARRFYFGNLDPFRMVANSRYQTDFEPPFRGLRRDPFDNQRGECEREDGPLARGALRSRITVLSCEPV